MLGQVQDGGEMRVAKRLGCGRPRCRKLRFVSRGFRAGPGDGGIVGVALRLVARSLRLCLG